MHVAEERCIVLVDNLTKIRVWKRSTFKIIDRARVDVFHGNDDARCIAQMQGYAVFLQKIVRCLLAHDVGGCASKHLQAAIVSRGQNDDLGKRALFLLCPRWTQVFIKKSLKKSMSQKLAWLPFLQMIRQLLAPIFIAASSPVHPSSPPTSHILTRSCHLYNCTSIAATHIVTSTAVHPSPPPTSHTLTRSYAHLPPAARSCYSQRALSQPGLTPPRLILTRSHARCRTPAAARPLPNARCRTPAAARPLPILLLSFTSSARDCALEFDCEAR